MHKVKSYKIMLVSLLWLSVLPLIVEAKKEPTLIQIIEAGLRHENLSSATQQGLIHRARKAAWLPTLAIGVDHSIKETETLSINDNISISGGDVTIGPEDNDLDSSSNVGTTLKVRAVWRLDELVYRSEERMLQSQTLDVYRVRREMKSYLAKIYEQRMVAKAKWHAKPDNFAYRAKYLALTQELDVLTGGQFSAQWDR